MTKRAAQAVLLAAGALLAAAIVLTFHRVPRPKSRPLPTPVPPGAPADAGKPTTLLSVFDYTETAAGRPRFRIHADRTVGFAQGAGLPSTWYGLEKVVLTLFSEKDPPITVSSDRADYDPRTNAAHLSGDVVVSDPSGTSVRTTRLEFDPRSNKVRLPEPIQFLHGGMAGRSSSAIYDLATREMSFAGPVTAQGSPGSATPFSSLSAESARYRRDSGDLEFSGSVHGQSGDNSLASETLTLHLTPERRLETADAAGGVSGILVSEGKPPSRDRYSGDQARVWFDTAGKLSRAALSGRPASVVEEASGAAGPRRLTASRLTLLVAGNAPTSAHARGGVRLEIPGTDASGRPASQTVEASRADAEYGPEGLISSVSFSGSVRGSSPQGLGTAPAGTYFPGANRTLLTGDSKEEAELSSPRGRLLAHSIEVDDARSLVTASDHARAFLTGEGQESSAPRFLASRREPTRARANRIVLDERRHTARLTGDAAMWQQDDALFADEILLNDAEHTAAADGSVRATALAADGGATPRKPGSGETPKPQRVTASSSRMRYDQTGRTAVFEEKVRVTRGSARAAGDRARIHFNEADQADSLALDGRVAFEDPATGRRGEGDHVLDEPLKGATVLTGDPAVARDGQGNRVTGAVLTFRKESGSVDAKAKDDKKIETIYQTHGA